jgi:hypothetical protein
VHEASVGSRESGVGTREAGVESRASGDSGSSSGCRAGPTKVLRWLWFGIRRRALLCWVRHEANVRRLQDIDRTTCGRGTSYSTLSSRTTLDLRASGIRLIAFRAKRSGTQRRLRRRRWWSGIVWTWRWTLEFLLYLGAGLVGLKQCTVLLSLVREQSNCP